MQTGIYLELNELGLSPGVAFFFKGVKVTKSQGFTNFNVVCKWKRKILGVAPEEGWFLLTNLDSLELAIAYYKKRFDIEEMFRDFKSGGYNLEETNVSGKRFITLIILISIAYTSATIQGQELKKNSEVRIQESESRRSFALGVPQARLANAALSVGDSDPPLIVRVASPLGRRPPNFQFVGGLKPNYSSASRTEYPTEFWLLTPEFCSIKRKGIQKYVGRVKEYGRTQRRHSSFYIGLYGNNWVNFMEPCIELVSELMKLNRNKLEYYLQGQKAMKLILSAL